MSSYRALLRSTVLVVVLTATATAAADEPADRSDVHGAVSDAAGVAAGVMDAMTDNLAEQFGAQANDLYQNRNLSRNIAIVGQTATILEVTDNVMDGELEKAGGTVAGAAAGGVIVPMCVAGGFAVGSVAGAILAGVACQQLANHTGRQAEELLQDTFADKRLPRQRHLDKLDLDGAEYYDRNFGGGYPTYAEQVEFHRRFQDEIRRQEQALGIPPLPAADVRLDEPDFSAFGPRSTWPFTGNRGSGDVSSQGSNSGTGKPWWEQGPTAIANEQPFNSNGRLPSVDYGPSSPLGYALPGSEIGGRPGTIPFSMDQAGACGPMSDAERMQLSEDPLFVRREADIKSSEHKAAHSDFPGLYEFRGQQMSHRELHRNWAIYWRSQQQEALMRLRETNGVCPDLQAADANPSAPSAAEGSQPPVPQGITASTENASGARDRERLALSPLAIDRPVAGEGSRARTRPNPSTYTYNPPKRPEIWVRNGKPLLPRE